MSDAQFEVPDPREGDVELFPARDSGPVPDDSGPAPDDSGPVPDDSGPVPDVAGLEAERDEYLGALQRLQADFENYRKRVLRQQEEQSARAALDLVGKLLPVLDTLDLAQSHFGGEPLSDEGRALDQARAQLLDVLGKEGLDRVDVVGVDFDPVVHDAVAHASEAEEDGAERDSSAAGAATVDEVLRSGYRWRGQVLRPAMVRVRG